MPEKINELETTAQKKKKILSAQAITSIIIIALLIIIPLIVYFWKQSEIKTLKKQHETELNNIKTLANDAIDSNNKAYIALLTRVFSWAVRSEMLRENMEQVSTYMTNLVKAADFNVISVIKNDGIVVVSTDKKYEGNVYPGTVTSELHQINEVASRIDNDGNVISICPVMGLDNRIGTLIITFTPKKPVF